MARQIKRLGRWMMIIGPLALLLVLLVRPQPSEASSFPGITLTTMTATPLCAPDPDCPPCEPTDVYSDDRVRYVDGAFNLPITLTMGPLIVGRMDVGLRFCSELDGASQFGNRVVPSWEYTVEKTIELPGTPEANGGHYASVMYPCGFVAIFDWTGSAYVPRSCKVTDVLTRPLGAGQPYRLTTKFGDEINFTAGGLPASREDSRGNTITYTYNTSTEQIQSITDDRGFSYTFSQNADGWVDEMEDPAGNVWEFGYDGNGNLTSVKSPATPSHPTGAVQEFAYSAYNRLTGIENTCGTTIKTIAYIGSGYQVDYVTMDGDTVDYTYHSGRTDRTDRLGNVFRTHFTGNKITQKDMWISSTATYVHTFSYGGDDYVAYEVLPRGNRIDYDWDANGNLLERRHRTANTGTNDSSDIVHTWTYSSNRVATYTDPLGNVTEYTRNGAGDVTQIDFPDVTTPSSQTASKTFAYNGVGQLTSVTDEEGKVATYNYFSTGDDIHLLQRVERDASGLDLETSYTYDDNWNVATVTDPSSGVTTYTYDALRRLTQEEGPSTLYKIKYEYDCAGRLDLKQVQNRDQDNAIVSANEWFDTTYAYTTLGDLASITEEIDSSNTRTTSFDYDDEQQLIRVTKPEGNKVKTEYNERGLVKKVIRGETSGDASEREYFYDANGNLIEEEDGRNYDTTHTYDLFDRKTRTTNAQGAYTLWTLDKRGQPTEIARKNSSDQTGLRQERFYDERGRLWKTEGLHKDPSTTYSDAVTTIARYKTGHVSTVTDARSKTTTTLYDNAWRRTKVTDHAGNFTEWTLDDNGNPTAWTIHDEDGGSDVEHEYEATYDAINRRLTSEVSG